MDKDNRKQLLSLFQVGLDAVRGDRLVAAALSMKDWQEPVGLIAIGKAAGAMAEGARQVLGDRLHEALIISKPGHLDDALRGWATCIEAGHPLPDHNSLVAGDLVVEHLANAELSRRWLILLSGGASSLVERLPEGYGLEDLRRLNSWLLGSGLPITQMNAIRQRVSLIKGGRLRAWLPRRTEVWLISDVPDDNPAVIGSGPCYRPVAMAPDWPSLPNWIRRWSEAAEGQAMPVRENEPPPHRVLANLDMALDAVEREARSVGMPVHRNATRLAGDAVAVGRKLADQLIAGSPGLWIAGGETTVVLPSEPGKGGRNQQLALAAAERLAGHTDCWLLAAGTDGTDGPTDVAGALVDGGTLERAALDGFQSATALAHADAYPLLEAAGDLIETGPTGTNVTDIILGYRA